MWPHSSMGFMMNCGSCAGEPRCSHFPRGGHSGTRALSIRKPRTVILPQSLSAQGLHDVREPLRASISPCARWEGVRQSLQCVLGVKGTDSPGHVSKRS